MGLFDRWRDAVVKAAIITCITVTALETFGNVASALFLETKPVDYPDLGIKMNIPVSWHEKFPEDTKKLGKGVEVVLVGVGEEKEEGDFAPWCLAGVTKGIRGTLVLRDPEFSKMFRKVFVQAEIIEENIVEIRKHDGELGRAIEGIGRQVVPGGTVVKIVAWNFLKDFKETGQNVYVLMCYASEKDFDLYNENVFRKIISSVHFTEK